MSIFDKMFGSGATAAAAAPAAVDRFTELKGKYASVMHTIEQQGVQVLNLHVEDNKLVIRGVAPNEATANQVWDQIKLTDANWANDVNADISVSEKKPETVPYTVKAGDSLWRIAKNELGDGQEYMKIFYANRDKLETPNSVFHPGDILQVPKS
ncbi:MAG: LysM peptidoglycan-binding domain-containing protein [Pyrinomonadaceae bacterium]